jgi:hypothetical protein
VKSIKLIVTCSPFSPKGIDFSDFSQDANSSLAEIKEPLFDPRIIALKLCKTSSARSGLLAMLGFIRTKASRKDDSTKESDFLRSRLIPSTNFQSLWEL